MNLDDIVLRDDQLPIYKHPARYRVLACGRRWGKTTLALKLLIAAARDGQQTWWVAPTYAQGFHPWRDLKDTLKDEWAGKLEREYFIELKGGGSISVKSADAPDSLRGIGLDFAVVDEAAFMHEDTWWSVLMPALADRRGRALFASTPRGRNWFYRAFTFGQDPLMPDWQSWHAPTKDNPKISEADLIATRQAISARIYAQEYEAEFLPDGGEVFHSVENAVRGGLITDPDQLGRTVMGIDFGKSHDFTALAIIDPDQQALIGLERFTEMSWYLQRARIRRAAERWRVTSILAESNAMGGPNIEALRRDGLPISAFTMTAQSKPPLIESLVMALDDGHLHLLEDAVLLGELQSYTYTTGRYGQQHYSAPPGAHDDTVIALALAWRLADRPRLRLGSMG